MVPSLTLGLAYHAKVELSRAKTLHPTAQKLVDTVIEMLETTSYKNIKSENVLLRSGISRGPLYHHFANFDDLIETAQAQIYVGHISLVVNELIRIAKKTNDPYEAQMILRNFVINQAVTYSSNNYGQRIGIIYNATFVPSLKAKLINSQEELTQQWISVYQLFVAKGWADPAIDTRGVSILMQSTFIGRVLDELSDIHMEPQVWGEVLTVLIDSFFFRLVPRENVG